jgi:hypothetical protein
MPFPLLGFLHLQEFASAAWVAGVGESKLRENVAHDLVSN